MKKIFIKRILAFFCCSLTLITIVIAIQGCYSFKGGSLPENIKTLHIAAVNDQSGFGNPEYKIFFTEKLNSGFRKDNTLALVDAGADSKLTVTIRSISEAPVSVNPGELEKERKITINCSIEFYDDVLKKSILKKDDLSRYAVYEVKDALTARNEAVKTALTLISEDVVFNVTSGGW